MLHIAFRSQRSVVVALDAILEKLDLPSVKTLSDEQELRKRQTVKNRFTIGAGKGKLLVRDMRADATARFCPDSSPRTRRTDWPPVHLLPRPSRKQ